MNDFKQFEIEVYKHQDTKKAILVGVSCMSNAGSNVWLPKSQISVETIKIDIKGHLVRVSLPEWLLIDKGLEGLVD